MTDSYAIRPGTKADEAAILALLPELTDFELPPARNPDDLWYGDAELVKQTLAGQIPETLIEVAIGDEQVMGLIVVTLREELMSHAPSAHLETIVVHPQARGTGLGKTLLARSEALAKEHGAQSLSLHVFANNQRARALYQSDGFDEELIRAIKWFN